MRFWTSWVSGNYADEGCTAPPFKFWVTGSIARPDDGISEELQKQLEKITDEDEYDQFINEHSRDDCTICAIIEAENKDAVWELVGTHFPDYTVRFCEERADDWVPGDRFR